MDSYNGQKPPNRYLGTKGYINEIGKLVYLPIPKCASTSLIQYCRNSKEWSGYAAAARAPEEYCIFAIIREPVDRYVSGILQYWTQVQNSTAKLKMDGDPHTFEEYIQAVVDHPPKVRDSHTTSQASHMCYEPRVDLLVPYDRNLKKVLDDLFESRGASPIRGLPRLNVNKERKALDALITQEWRDQVYEYYAEDVELWERACNPPS